MQRRILGRTNLDVGRLSLGCVTFGREIGENESFAILDHAVDGCGINLLDTAEAYGGGRSEEVVGKWLATRRGARERVHLQTKVTPPLGRRRVLESLEASLRRLQVDAVDVFMLHAFDPATPVWETLEALGEIVRAGKARFVGCSNFTAGQLAAALALADDDDASRGRLDVAQFNYNLVVRGAEETLLPACRRHGVAAQTYSPLGAGFLTGKYAPGRPVPAASRFDVIPGHQGIYFHEDKFLVAGRLSRLAARVGIPAPRLAAAWVLQNDDVDTVLVGARSRDHVDSAVAALDVRFDADWNEELIHGRRRVAQWLAS